MKERSGPDVEIGTTALEPVDEEEEETGASGCPAPFVLGSSAVRGGVASLRGAWDFFFLGGVIFFSEEALTAEEALTDFLDALGFSGEFVLRTVDERALRFSEEVVSGAPFERVLPKTLFSSFAAAFSFLCSSRAAA